MGGDIWFKSSEGQGSTFHFVARMPKLGSEEEAEVACLATGTKVLVLCEHKRSREVLCKQIERMDVQIFDGSMEQLEQSQELLDVAFVDLDEAIDRLEVAQNLVATNKARACVLLAFPSPKVPMEEELKKAGILRILLKPVSPMDLKRFLMKAPDFKSSQTPIPVLTPSRRLRVLLVEDNEVNTVLMRRLLERLGHEVVHVGNGTRALEVLRDEKVDVVLMDVQMPGMDGFETTQRIRREEDGANVSLRKFGIFLNKPRNFTSYMTVFFKRTHFLLDSHTFCTTCLSQGFIACHIT
jgi:CheY-like chemotaxis protein